MDTHEPEAIYSAALALLARYRTAGVTPDLDAWCLGYRGPAPQSRAAVAALVAELRAETPRIPCRLGP